MFCDGVDGREGNRPAQPLPTLDASSRTMGPGHWMKLGIASMESPLPEAPASSGRPSGTPWTRIGSAFAASGRRMVAAIGGFWRILWSSVPAVRLLRPPMAGLLIGGAAAAVAILWARSLAAGSATFLAVWLLSLTLFLRAYASLPRLKHLCETPLVHERLRLGLLAGAIAGVYVLTSEFLVLVAATVPMDLIIPAVEVTVLGGTVAYLAMFARFTASAFTADMDRLIQETRASGGLLRDNFLVGTKSLGDAFGVNTDRLLGKLDEGGEKQARILVGMTDALNEVAALLKDQRAVTEETRKLGEESLRLQQETDAARRKLEAERTAAQRQAEEEARRRMMPKLGLRVRVSAAGLFWHHVFVDVLNAGMSGQGLKVALKVDGSPLMLLGGTLSAQELKPFDFGDVSTFPLDATLRVDGTIADVTARVYRFSARFSYRRTTGFWNQTKSAWVEPPDFVWPDAAPA